MVTECIMPIIVEIEPILSSKELKKANQIPRSIVDEIENITVHAICVRAE